METAILNYLRENPGTSFAELCRDIPGFAGDLALNALDCRNLILWNGISQQAADALAKLDRNSQLEYKITDVVPYFIDGQMSSFPRAQVLKDYARLHWLPTLIYAA